MTGPTRFDTLPALVRAHAQRDPARPALIEHSRTMSWGALDALADRVAASLQRDGIQPRHMVALCAANSIEHVAAWVGVLRAGAVAVPLPTGATPSSLAAMLADSASQLLFTDEAADRHLAPVAHEITARRVSLDTMWQDTTSHDMPPQDSARGAEWLAPEGAVPAPVTIEPAWPFNLIYSSGTTGNPKGIVQSHAMRWAHIRRGELLGYGPDSVTMVALPLYSNSALVSVLPALGMGGTLVLMPRFEAGAFLALAERYRATHAMLVPVLFERILAHPDFDRTDLSSFRMKSCTSAPFGVALKQAVLRRWPGGLVEFYGMSEGGASCMLVAHERGDKLHTVGQPQPGHEIRLIDAEGREVPRGEVGEVVGRSPMMMTGYHNRPADSAAAEWFDAAGRRFIRLGDLGRLDDEGFLTLVGRVKEVIISGGQNVYPSDLEAVLREHPQVADVAVVGVPSETWGETPVAFVVPAAGTTLDTGACRAWANARLGKAQRISAVRAIPDLPRSAIGKVLRRALRDRWERDG